MASQPPAQGQSAGGESHPRRWLAAHLDPRRWDGARLSRGLFELLISGAVLVLVFFAAWTAVLEYQNARDERDRLRSARSAQAVPSATPAPSGEQPATLPPDQAALAAAEAAREAAARALADAQQALHDVDQTSNSLSLLLSFLEGATVLAGLALGATAYFGFRDLSRTKGEVDVKLKDLDQYSDSLADLQKTLDEQEALRRQINRTSIEAADLLFVYQEFNLKNYVQAYTLVMPLLERDDQRNPHTLYIAGWLEIQHITGKLDQGIEHLRQALEIRPNWPHARAAYGVALRRKARATADPAERENIFFQAEGILLNVLGESPNLLELNMESFWATVGGLRRDMGRLDEAIQAYRKAIQVTPYSSYPHGNLAMLLLQKARHDATLRDEALDTFAETARLAGGELALVPFDYFHTMDIAMSRMMLGRRDRRSFAEAHAALDQALAIITVTPEMLDTSLRGWRYLLEHCPDDDEDWRAVRDQLEVAIGKVSAAIEELKRIEAERALEKERAQA